MTYKKKLIEVALPLAAINAAAAKQKTMGAAPHPQNLHRWWARRPLAATRAVLWASLVDDPSAHADRFPTLEEQQLERKRLFDLLERLVPWEANNDERLLAEARAEIVRSCDGELPTIVDPFGGGGAIPIEALRLGLPTVTGDLNPVAVLIQRAMLEIPPRFVDRPPVHPDVRESKTVWDGARGLAADVEAYGRAIQQTALRQIGHFYSVAPRDGSGPVTPIAWIWARTVKSPDPAWPAHVPLVRSWTLFKKAGRPTVWVEPEIDSEARRIEYFVRTGGTPPEGNVSRQGATCLATGTPIPFSYIRNEAQQGRMSQQLMAVVAEANGNRVYLSPTDSDALPDDLPVAEGPPGAIFDWPGRTNVVRYGLDEWSKLFMPRQLLALTTFSDLLREVRSAVQRDALAAGVPDDAAPLREGGTGAAAYAEAVVTYLALVVDRCADYWSSVCSWHAPNSQLRETFARQAIPMTWDFCEANPFSGRMASWDSMLKTCVRAIPTLATSAGATTAQRDARARVEDAGTSVLATDPPYYDNICYADLSDFFYVWLRRNVADIWPDECATLATPKADELIANQYRAGSKKAAKEHFEKGIQAVFEAASLRADPRFPATIFYAFKATESSDEGITSTGWETFLSGLLESGYAITATWPMRTEMGFRVLAAGANALASSIVLACRPRELTAPMATRGELVAALRSEMDPAVRLLQLENIAPVDLAQSAIGPGIAIFSRYAKVVEADGLSMPVRSALALINEVLAEILSGEESEFDADTRFALTWFEQFGHNPGPFGDADLLARAKDTTVVGVERSGLVASREGKVRLLERRELREDWDPVKDERRTVWEMTQYLIRALDSSESDAAELLARIGEGQGLRARQLAYLLYGVCERKKWAEDATAYNTLVTAWPEVSRLAATGLVQETPEQLF